MRRKAFRSIDEVLGSDLLLRKTTASKQVTDRILKSTKLEDKVYSELRKDDVSMDALESIGSKKLPSFTSLSRDIYQSFYSLNVRRRDEAELSETAKVINSHIVNDVMSSDDYSGIKSVCEGRQLPSYDAAAEFTERVTDGIDGLLEAATGNKDMLNALEKAVQHEEKLKKELEQMLEQRESKSPDSEHDKQAVDTANKLSSKAEQIQAMERQIQDNLIKNKQEVKGLLTEAVKAAGEKAEETALAMAAWGQGGDSSPEKMKLDRDTVNRVRSSQTLREVSKFLGRFKEMLAKQRKNSYAYGRGEKYTLEFGNDLQRLLTSEFSMLALPEASALFLRKYQGKRLKQYKRREAVYKGCGDIIMCLDESSSTLDEAPWGKAVALALLDVAMHGNRKFALIHFSGKGKYKTDLFLPGTFGAEEMMNTAETFLGGGTDFETPLREALRLIKDKGFENADIVFTSDGECELPEGFRKEFEQTQAANKFKVTGILLDGTSPGFEFSLTPFCDEVFRTSEISQEGIVEAVLAKRA